MTKKLLSIFLLFILCYSTIDGVILELNDLSKFEGEVSKLERNALVIFDVDYIRREPSISKCKDVIYDLEFDTSKETLEKFVRTIRERYGVN